MSKYFVLLLSGILILQAGCAPPTVPVEPPPVSAAAPPSDAGDVYVSKLDDPGAKALFLYGQAMLLLGDGATDEALASLQEAIRLDPDTAELRFLLAQIYGEQGQLKEARRTLEDLLIRNPESTKALLALGNIALGQKEPKLAVSYFRRIMVLEPDNSMVPLQLSIALVRLGEADQAIEVLKQLLQKFPDSMAGRLTLARLYRDMDLKVLAEEQYRYLIDNLGNVIQAYLDLGFMYENQQDMDEALRLFKEALQLNPHDLALRHHLARVYVQMKQYDNALDELNRIVQLDPGDAEARRKIGLIYMEQGRWDEAAAQFRDMLAIDPALDPARYYLGSVLEQQQDWAAAMDAFSAIPETSALYEDAISHIGFLLIKLNRADDAIALYESRMENGEPRAQNYYYLATILMAENSLERALAVTEQATQQFPDNADLLYQKGIALERLGRHDLAIEVMQSVIRLDPGYAEAMNFIAYAYAEKNTNLDEALELAKKAIEIKPAPHIHDTLGWVYYRLKRFEKARSAIEAASRELPDDPVVLSHLADVYLGLKKFELARKVSLRMLELDPDNAFAKNMLKTLDAASPAAHD